MAVKNSGLLVTPASGIDAPSVFAPSWTVQLPTVAMPLVPVVIVSPVTLPPPPVTANVTSLLGTGKPSESTTSTAGGTFKAYPMSPVWPFPAVTMSCLGAPGTTPVAWNFTGPVPDTVAISVLLPVPTVQLPTVAMPLPFVVGLAPVTLPPPESTAKATAAPATRLLYWSRTCTAGRTGTGVPCAARWLSPAWTTTEAGGPAFAVAVNAAVSPPPVTVACCEPEVVPSVQFALTKPLPSVIVPPGVLNEPVIVIHVTATPAMGEP